MQDIRYNISITSVSVKYAALFCVIAICLSIFPKIFSVDPTLDWVWTVISFIVFVVIVISAHKNYKDDRNGYMTFSQGFGIGFLISIISAFLTSLFTYIYFRFIDPDVFKQVLDQSIEMWEARGMENDQIEMASGFITPGFTSFMIFMVYSFGGLLISLIIPIFTQKENPDPFA